MSPPQQRSLIQAESAHVVKLFIAIIAPTGHVLPKDRYTLSRISDLTRSHADHPALSDLTGICKNLIVLFSTLNAYGKETPSLFDRLEADYKKIKLDNFIISQQTLRPRADLIRFLQSATSKNYNKHHNYLGDVYRPRSNSLSGTGMTSAWENAMLGNGDLRRQRQFVAEIAFNRISNNDLKARLTACARAMMGRYVETITKVGNTEPTNTVKSAARIKEGAASHKKQEVDRRKSYSG